jgi:hypothetical protein
MSNDGGLMKTPVEQEPGRRERKNADIERGADNNESEERPRRQNRGRRAQATKRSARKERGRS